VVLLPLSHEVLLLVLPPVLPHLLLLVVLLMLHLALLAPEGLLLAGSAPAPETAGENSDDKIRLKVYQHNPSILHGIKVAYTS
jgi:hypothetical protein